MSQKPIQYQQGWTEFYKLRINLSEDVLIPRPESELLVDEVIKIAKSRLRIAYGKDKKIISHMPSAISIVDVGTGSGCIAISIAKNLLQARIWALDISKKALKVAEENAKLHKVENQILFLESDLLEILTNKYDRLVYHTKIQPDIMVANLPYIPTPRLKFIDPMVTDFEPRVALDGGEDGFELYRKLFQQISRQPRRLQPKFMVCEIDYTHGELAVQEALKYFPKADVEVKEDLAHLQRILKIKF